MACDPEHARKTARQRAANPLRRAFVHRQAKPLADRASGESASRRDMSMSLCRPQCDRARFRVCSVGTTIALSPLVY
jgi:hypothetical protein